MGEVKEFNLDDDDYDAIGIAKDMAYYFLNYPHIKQKQIIGLWNAIYALERFPHATEGINCEFGLTYRAGTKKFNEMKYIAFRLSEEEFEISAGGSVYDSSVGGDSYSDPGWFIGVNGYKKSECEIYNIKNKIIEYLNLGAKITVDDESFIKYEEKHEDIYELEENSMPYKDRIIEYVAQKACENICRRITRTFQKMTEGMQSGDDSPLKNVWDEICVQVQDEKFIAWEVYLDTIRQFIEDEIGKIDNYIKQAIWLQTEEGFDWQCNNE